MNENVTKCTNNPEPASSDNNENGQNEDIVLPLELDNVVNNQNKDILLPMTTSQLIWSQLIIDKCVAERKNKLQSLSMQMFLTGNGPNLSKSVSCNHSNP